ncbi:uncharacterized protein EV422DRAFT_238737 [Fimicolochytrium jonesii]|uniref:uncharacterized protein n=1 Tax=Fimicolochytrium jonesii TaxID=1396493 RepID=UPI0022FECBEC|nr:uncharacterized protein EV422DRAFT_238737 [Fimicolochytrium jonesii]KAI8824943.1 hypothetical protein EV422DRAFT_238737 [Fimicolochytrium jonesii]
MLVASSHWDMWRFCPRWMLRMLMVVVRDFRACRNGCRLMGRRLMVKRWHVQWEWVCWRTARVRCVAWRTWSRDVGMVVSRVACRDARRTPLSASVGSLRGRWWWRRKRVCVWCGLMMRDGIVAMARSRICLKFLETKLMPGMVVSQADPLKTLLRQIALMFRLSDAWVLSSPRKTNGRLRSQKKNRVWILRAPACPPRRC